MLTYYFNRWRLRRATLALVAALGEADLRVQLGSSESQLGEKGVNGIIHNVATVDGRAAEGFIENLVCQDVSVLLKTARPNDVSCFLSQMVALARPDLVAVFGGFNASALKHVVACADWTERLWLLWNVSCGYTSLARSLMDAAVGGFLPERRYARVSTALGACAPIEVGRPSL